MKILLLITLAAVMISSSGCFPTAMLDVKPKLYQNVIYKDNDKIVLSERKSDVVLRLVDKKISRGLKVTFWAAVINMNSPCYNFSTDNIRAKQGITPLKIFSYDEMMQEIRAGAQMRSINAQLAGLATLTNNYNAGYQYVGGNVNINGFSGNYSGYIYDQGKADESNRNIINDTNSKLNSIYSDEANSLTTLYNTYIKKQTICTKQVNGGNFIITTNKSDMPSDDIEIVINVDGDDHEFTITNTLVD